MTHGVIILIVINSSNKRNSRRLIKEKTEDYPFNEDMMREKINYKLLIF